MAGATAEQRFLAAVDQIYTSAAGRHGWEPALGAVVDFVGAQAADLNFLDTRTQQVTRMVTARVDPDAVRRYVANMGDDLIHRNPRAQRIYLQMGQDHCVADSDIWSTHERRTTPFFEELRRSARQYDGLNSWVTKAHGAPTWIALMLQLGPSQGEPDAAMRLRLRMLLPHLRRACEVEARLQQAERETLTLAAALDNVNEAVALVDAGGRIAKANDRALALLRAADGIALAVDQRVVVARSDARDAFARALALCASPLLLLDQRGAPPPAQVTVIRKCLRPLVLTLQPLPEELKGAYGAVAILFIADPDAQPADFTAALRAAYRLSPTEAKVVQALSRGESLRDFSDANQMSYETVRSHVRRIFMKTGARRQSDLVRLALNLG